MRPLQQLENASETIKKDNMNKLVKASIVITFKDKTKLETFVEFDGQRIDIKDPTAIKVAKLKTADLVFNQPHWEVSPWRILHGKYITELFISGFEYVIHD